MKYIAIILAMMLLTVGAFAEDASLTKQQVIAQGLMFNLDKAIVGAQEVVTQLEETEELESIISQMEELRDSIDISSITQEEFNETREEAKELVTQFRELVSTELTDEQKQELKETIQAKQKEALEARRAEYEAMREEFNNKRFEEIQARLQERFGEDFNATEMREKFADGNFTNENAKALVAALKEKAAEWQNMTVEERQAYAQDMKERAEQVREKMQNKSMEDARQLENGEMTQEEFLENQKEHRREAIAGVIGDDALAQQIANEADRVQDEAIDEMDTNGDGEVSEEEAMAYKEKLIADMPQLPPGMTR